MANPWKVRIQDLSIRFRLSYDKTWNFTDKVAQVSKKLITGVKPRYFVALEDINLEVRQGEIVGIIGPNGSGKSTLLRAISGIYHPDQGTVDKNGRISTLLSLGTGFDNNLTGLDNIRLNGLIIGMHLEEIEQQISQIVNFADIGDHINQPMKYYSSGMISRLSFAIVLAMKPDILLIDEIFSVGDLAFQAKSEKAMHELLEKASCQLIVTHSLSMVERHCNRALYIRGGRIVLDDEPDKVVARYKRECYSV